MKKLFIALMCVLLAGLCACGPVKKPGQTTTTPNIGTFPDEEIVWAKTTKHTTEATETTIKTPETTNEDPYYSIYEENSEKYPHAMNNLYYFLYDVDGDGTNELLFGAEWMEDIHLTAVYSIKDGVAVWQEGFVNLLHPDFTNNPPLLFKNGTIMMGKFSYYRLEDGEIKRKTVVEEDGKCYNFIVYEPYPGTPITKEEFERVRTEYEGDGQIVEVDWKPLAEYGQ